MKNQQKENPQESSQTSSVDSAISGTAIDEYIAGFSGLRADRLNELVALIRGILPEAEEKISYQMPTFKGIGNIVHFAAFKGHIGLYPGPAAIEKFAEELKGYKTSKGAIQLALDKQIPKTLVRKIVKFAQAKDNSRLHP